MDPTFERILDEIRQFLKEARNGELSKEDEEYLRTLTDTWRNLVNLQETGECDHDATLKIACQTILYGDYVCLKNNAAVFSQKVNEVKEAESKGMPEILQSKIEEIKGYFAKLSELIKNMDNLAKKISDKVNEVFERNCKLTEKERIEVKFLNIDFKTVVKKTADYFNQADRVLKMFESDVVSYKNGQKDKHVFIGGVSLLATIATAGLASTVVGMLAAAAAGYTSGNQSNATFHTSGNSSNATFHLKRSYTLPCIVGAAVALTGIVLSLALVWKGWASKRNFCDKLLLIIRDYRDLIDESQRISFLSV